MSWININDQLPEEYSPILVRLDSGCVLVAQYEGPESPEYHPGKLIYWSFAKPYSIGTNKISVLYTYFGEEESYIEYWMPYPYKLEKE